MEPPDRTPPATEPPKDYRDRYEELTGVSLRLCPVCRRGRMIRKEVPPPTLACTSPTLRDTSCECTTLNRQLCKLIQDKFEEKCLPIVLPARRHSFLTTHPAMNPCSSVTRLSAITPLCVRLSLSRERAHDSIPIAPAASRRFLPIHFYLP